MIRITLVALAILMGGCAQTPFTPAPPIAKLNIQPVSDGNKAISEGNKKIGQSAQILQTKLVTTREKLDAAIVAAHQQKKQNAQLDQSLADASKSLNDAITENTNLRMTTYTQQQKIDVQDAVIKDLSDNNEARQKIIDGYVKELNEGRQKVANYEAQEKLDHRWWGIGYFIHGAKYLGWRLLIVAVILSVVGFVVNMFGGPLVAPFFAAIIGFFVKLPGRIARFLIGLFKRKTPPS